ncbi:MAG: ester cyclase [Bacteroidales bacterium]|nr:ester cyclase [Bacteroidales bacterium]
MKKNLLALVVLVLVFASGSLYAQKNTDIEKNKDFIEVFTKDFWNKQNIAAFETYFTSDYIYHNAEGDMNAEQYKGLCQAYLSAFPDLHITTDYLVAEGDRVVKVWTAHSTHTSDFMGIPASGKSIVIKGIEMFRIADGKIAELWACMDNLGMLQQLGVIPPMGE